jgi:hypothetical protein
MVEPDVALTDFAFAVRFSGLALSFVRRADGDNGVPRASALLLAALAWVPSSSDRGHLKDGLPEEDRSSGRRGSGPCAGLPDVQAWASSCTVSSSPVFFRQLRDQSVAFVFRTFLGYDLKVHEHMPCSHKPWTTTHGSSGIRRTNPVT